MIKTVAATLVLWSVIFASGCATMIRGTSEKLMITSEPDGAQVKLSDGRSCKTPCQMECKRNQTLILKFSKEGHQEESLTVCPTLAGAGVILGGLIDYGTGAVYSLQPNPAHVILNPIHAGGGQPQAPSLPTAQPAASNAGDKKRPAAP